MAISQPTTTGVRRQAHGDGPPSVLRHAQRRVRALLKQGRYDDLAQTSYGRLHHFVQFLDHLGVFGLFSSIGLAKKRNGVPLAILAMVWMTKSLLGFAHTDNLREMFKDPHVSRLLGFSGIQVIQGYSRRTKPKGAKPIHPDTVRNFAKLIPASLSEGLANDVLRIIQKRQPCKSGVFTVDAKCIWVWGKMFEGAAETWDYKTNKMRTGYKLLLLQQVEQDRHYAICAILLPANVHESQYLLPLLDKGIHLLGKGVIRTLLIDRGFLDGHNLFRLKDEYKIDFIIPGRDDLDVVKDAEGITQLPSMGLQPVAPKTEALGIEGLTTWASYAGTVNIALVSDARSKKKLSGRPVSYLTSLPLPDAASAFRVHRAYAKRWTIENNAFKELAHNWSLASLPGWSLGAIHVHIYFTLTAFNLVLLFRGKFGCVVVAKSAMTVRRNLLKEDRIAVYIGEEFGLFAVLELTSLLCLPRPP